MPPISSNSNEKETSATPIDTFSDSGYLEVHVDLNSTNVACSPNAHILIYILSSVYNVKRREMIRSTWGSKIKGTCFVFILGKISDSVIHTSPIKKRIKYEEETYRDLIQIDHLESYVDVIYKEIAALLWAKRFYPQIPFLFKTDDDLLVDTILISKIAEILAINEIKKDPYLERYRPSLLTHLNKVDRNELFQSGWVRDHSITLRGTHKFAIDRQVWPYRYLPSYCSGFGWFISRTVRDKLINASYSYPINMTVWIGDVFVSGFLAKAANVNCTRIEIDYDENNSGECACRMTKNPMLAVCSSAFHAIHGRTKAQQKYNEYEDSWKVIRRRHTLPNHMSLTTGNC